jgi:hypothetical protein
VQVAAYTLLRIEARPSAAGAQARAVAVDEWTVADVTALFGRLGLGAHAPALAEHGVDG